MSGIYDQIGGLSRAAISLITLIAEHRKSLTPLEANPAYANSFGAQHLRNEITRLEEDLLFLRTEIILARERFRRRVRT